MAKNKIKSGKDQIREDRTVHGRITSPVLTLDKRGNLYDEAMAMEQTDLGHEELLKALYFFWDGFERATLDYFLVKDTAKQAIKGEDLSGDKLTLGIRRMEWNNGVGIFKAFVEHEKVSYTEIDDCLVFDFKGIPVYLYIYEENPCLTSFDTVFYQYETFNTPNPFKEFCEKYDK